MALLRDLGALYDLSRNEETQGIHSTTDCKIVVNGNVAYAHRAILISRSTFFKNAFAHAMLEAQSKTIELNHVDNEVSKAALDAFLRFCYVDDPGEMAPPTAWGVLKLVGAAEDEGGFFGLTECASLREICGHTIMNKLGTKDILNALRNVYVLGGNPQKLKQVLVENVFYHMEEFSEQEEILKLVKQFPKFTSDVLSFARTHVDSAWRPKTMIMSPHKPWNLTLSGSYPGLSNSFEALNDLDMSTGAGTQYQVNPWIQATFREPVVVTVVYVGIGDMGQGWSISELSQAQIQYKSNGSWITALTLCVDTSDKLFTIKLPRPVTASNWRVTYDDARMHHLGISFLGFE